MKTADTRTPEHIREVALNALLDVAGDRDAPAAARAGAARTMLESIGAIGRNQDLTRIDEKRSAAEMTPDEIAAEINRLSARMPKPKLTKLKLGGPNG